MWYQFCILSVAASIIHKDLIHLVPNFYSFGYLYSCIYYTYSLFLILPTMDSTSSLSILYDQDIRAPLFPSTLFYPSLQPNPLHGYSFTMLFIFISFWSHHVAFGILVPQPGIKSWLLGVNMPGPNHQRAREFPVVILLSALFILRFVCFSYKLHSGKGNDFMYIIWWIFTQVCTCEITTLLPILLTFRSLNSLYQIWPSFSLWFLGLHLSLGRSSLRFWWKYNSLFFSFSQFSLFYF